MSLKVLQWNCMYSEDPARIADFIASTGTDAVCLQELTKGYHFREGTGEYIAHKLGFHSYCAYGPMVLPDGTQTEMGNGILSRYPLKKQLTIPLQEGRAENGRVVQDARFYLEVHIELEGKEVRIGTTHLPFHPRFQTTPAKQAMVERIISALPPHDAPYILCGDLNTTPFTKAAATFRRSAHLKNAGPALHVPTWTTKPFSIGPWQYSMLKWRLDYVLYQGTGPARARVLETTVSDHLPILAEFAVWV